MDRTCRYLIVSDTTLGNFPLSWPRCGHDGGSCSRDCGVRLASFPRMSLLRAVNSGLQHVAWLALMDIRIVFSHPQVLLIFMALAIMVATQFSSTILLLDFSD